MRSLVVFVCLCVLVTVAVAQTGLGTITGFISDPSGAAVANATIEARNSETGALYSVSSTETGNYAVNALPVGRYELSLNVPGFKKYNRQNLMPPDIRSLM